MTTEFVTDINALLSAPQKRRFKITEPLPICGQRFRIQSLTEAELSRHEAAAVSKDGFVQARMEDASRRLVARCLVDGEGNRLLSDNQAGRLAGMDAADMKTLYEACAEHVGIKRASTEDIGKNSDTIPAA